MRIHLKISPTEASLSYNYQPIITSALHKWLGSNNYHDEVSLYSFSWLRGAKAVEDGLRFPNGGSFFISSYSSDLLQQLILGIQSYPQIDKDLLVSEIIIQREPEFGNEERLFSASPILIKRKDNDRGERHFTFKDPESDQFMTQTLKTRLKQAGLGDDGVNVAFDRDYHSPKTKVVYYKDIGNKVSICPVKISGTSEQIAFAWNVGMGNSTGIGFGALK